MLIAKETLKRALRPAVRRLRGWLQDWRDPPYRESSEPFLSVDWWLQFANVRADDAVSPAALLRKVRRRKRPIVFIESGSVAEYLGALNAIRKPFLLITMSNDDVCVPYPSFPNADQDREQRTLTLLNSPYLLGWITKNPCLSHTKLIGVPLGPKWQWSSTRFFGESKKPHLELFRRMENPYRRFRDLAGEKTGLLYCNFADTTAEPFFEPHRGMRQLVRALAEDRFHWNPSEPFEQYLQTLATYKFCLSPPGRGIDTHRTWEALMVGTIPVVISSPLDALFEKLPVLVVKDWSIVTEAFLLDQYEQFRTRDYDFAICYTPYWAETISNLQA